MENGSLETHCNKDCKLFFTNPISTPLVFRGYLHAASLLRERQKRGLPIKEKNFPQWAFDAWFTAERVYELIENEKTESISDSDSNDLTFEAGKGDTDAFAEIEKKLLAKK